MRLLIVLAAVAALAVAFVLLRPDDDDEDTAATTATTATTASTVETAIDTAPTADTTATTPEPVRLVVTVRDGRPVGGIARADASEGEPILLVVRSDVADHVHVHGYDLMADVGPGQPARMQFRATLTGRFEIELEDRAEQIAQLTVVP